MKDSTGSLDEALANGARLLASDPEAAADQARAILSVNRSVIDAHRLLGAALRRLGRGQEAEGAECYAIDAAMASAPLVEAARRIQADDLKGAEHGLRSYLTRRPFDAAAMLLLADVASRSGIQAEAERLIRRALEAAPAHPGAQLALATVLNQQNRPAEALDLLERLGRRNPDDLQALLALASLLGQLGEYERAIALYERALDRHAEVKSLWLGYGNVLKTVGRSEDSIAAYRRALALDPASGEAWWSLANLKTFRFGDTEMDAIEAALQCPDVRENDRLQLHFALGKALEDKDCHGNAFAHYAEGNRIRRLLVPHDAEAASDEARRAAALFTPAFLAQRAGSGSPVPDPIFIVGMPRAGSTLIEQILSSHSMIEGTSELPILPALVQRMLGERWRNPGARYPDVLDQLGSAELSSMGEAYLEAARPHRKTGKPFFTDKLPNNWAHVGLIQLILPNARIVDARRHPLDCCSSNFRQHFAHGQSFAYDLADLGRYYRDYVALMRHFDAVLPGRVHRVVHERLLDDPETGIRALLDYLGVPFEPACLSFHENERAVRTASAEQVRQPINRRGLNRWKPYEAWLGPLKQALGPVLDAYPDVPAA